MKNNVQNQKGGEMKLLGYIYGTILRVMEKSLTANEALDMIEAALKTRNEPIKEKK